MDRELVSLACHKEENLQDYWGLLQPFVKFAVVLQGLLGIEALTRWWNRP
jgi:hypothetical protein